MFWKLCKMEMKYSWRSFTLLYAVLILCSLFLNVSGSVSNNSSSALMNFFQGFMVLMFFAAIFSIVILVFVNIIRNYSRSMFGRNSYLTHTLPVSSTQLLLSKLLIGLLWGLVSGIVIITSTLIFTFRALGDIPSISEWMFIIDQLQIFHWRTLLMLFNLLVEYAHVMLLIFLVMTLVHTNYVQKYRTPLGIAIYLVINFIETFIVSSLLELMNIGNSVTASIHQVSRYVESSVWIILVLNLVLFVVHFMGTKYLIDHKLDVE